MTDTVAVAAPPVARCLADIECIERTPWQECLSAENTYDLIRAACERWPQRIALRLLTSAGADAPTRELRYDELLAGIHRMANLLHARGVAPGGAVAILLPNLIEGHLALWGAQAAGIASPINPLLDADYIARICSETKAQVISGDLPLPAPGQVRVRLAATSVNPIDLKRAGGYGRRLPGSKGAAHFPLVLGNDLAGWVDALASAVCNCRSASKRHSTRRTSRLLMSPTANRDAPCFARDDAEPPSGHGNRRGTIDERHPAG